MADGLKRKKNAASGFCLRRKSFRTYDQFAPTSLARIAAQALLNAANRTRAFFHFALELGRTAHISAVVTWKRRRSRDDDDGVNVAAAVGTVPLVTQAGTFEF